MPSQVVIESPIIKSPFAEPARDKDKTAKVATARNLWIPPVDNAGTWGRWAFIEIADPWDAKKAIRTFVATSTVSTAGGET